MTLRLALASLFSLLALLTYRRSVSRAAPSRIMPLLDGRCPACHQGQRHTCRHCNGAGTAGSYLAHSGTPQERAVYAHHFLRNHPWTR